MTLNRHLAVLLAASVATHSTRVVPNKNLSVNVWLQMKVGTEPELSSTSIAGGLIVVNISPRAAGRVTSSGQLMIGDSESRKHVLFTMLRIEKLLYLLDDSIYETYAQKLRR